MATDEAGRPLPNRFLGVCYYPEQWPSTMWREDARRMVALGLGYVRIGEFAWSRIEPRRNEVDFGWLDDAIAVLGGAGLKVVLGTPTATPPKWLIDAHPEILPVDPETGRVRGFGSRRHYDFSSVVYRKEALRITEALARRYGRHEAVAGWQTDNELCCHETALSASVAALHGFRRWCRNRYGGIARLNAAWGNVFWSMEYVDFDEIELPFGAVTEVNPAHMFAFRQYSSDCVVSFHAAMVSVIREHSPDHFVTHNFIPMPETGVDNRAIAAPLDFASYDNYPLGRTDLAFADMPTELFRRYMRTGHPDLAAFFHDQTRGLSRKPFWIMEQQPGPVNWARHNPRPAAGMVRLWSLEAFAHGAGCVSFFRWRQAPFGQEQMHAGLLRPDQSKAEGWDEIERLAHDLETLALEEAPRRSASVAIITDPRAQWVADIERQGAGFDYTKLLFSWYAALRHLGVDVDFITQSDEHTGYRLLLAPGLSVVDDTFAEKVAQGSAHILFGPRSGAKTEEFSIAEGLPPGPAIRRLIPFRVTSVETLRDDCTESLNLDGREYESLAWREALESDGAEVLATYGDGSPAMLGHGQVQYLGCLTDNAFLQDLFASLCRKSGVETVCLPEDMRIARRGDLVFAFNYADRTQRAPAPERARFRLGAHEVEPRGVSVWEERS